MADRPTILFLSELGICKNFSEIQVHAVAQDACSKSFSYYGNAYDYRVLFGSDIIMMV